MSTVGEQLQKAREARGLTVEQVAEITKIRVDHLRALEAGDFSVFPALVYVRGFVRTYATLLKLDVHEVLAGLEEELGRTRDPVEPLSLSKEEHGVLDFLMLQLSKVDWRKGAVAMAVMVLAASLFLGVVAWKHYRSADPLKGLKPGVYQPPQKHSGETLPLPSTPAKR